MHRKCSLSDSLYRVHACEMTRSEHHRASERAWENPAHTGPPTPPEVFLLCSPLEETGVPPGPTSCTMLRRMLNGGENALTKSVLMRHPVSSGSSRVKPPVSEQGR